MSHIHYNTAAFECVDCGKTASHSEIAPSFLRDNDMDCESRSTHYPAHNWRRVD